MKRHVPITIAAGALAVSTALTGSAISASAEPSAPASFAEPYRPQFHYTPARNWMNDPNGLVYYKGEYHLFYQHNPDGNSWGNMSWGHAVSSDLVHWKELPLAISHDENEMIFSGSVVVDHQNTTGFGTRANPAMVAVYTSNPKAGSDQNQALAYSLDRGRTWTKYDGNPVLDIDNNEFRDPKVQWYAPTQSWLMTIVKATERKVAFYSSKDLKSWTHLSDFGPQGAVGGVWECPDLFPLPVDGDSKKQKWVLLVSLNPGHLYGGSGTQYFVGEFDGTRFTPDDDGSYEPPAELSVFEDFESESFDDWTATGTAFGPGPAPGAAAGTDQGGVSNYLGERLANSFHGFDGSTGTLTSPTFTVQEDFLNFRIGGGNHPHNPDEILDPPAPVAASMIADFEGGSYGEGWISEGNAFGTAPSTGTIGDQQEVTGFEGSGLVNTFIDHDRAVGTLTSPEFEITNDYINFLIGGGRHPMSEADPTAVNLIVDGEVVRTATGKDAERLTWSAWDVSELRGQTARLEVVDQNTGGWGHINLDSVMLSDEPAQPASIETTVNLVVDGQIVESETGPNSERLDSASFDLRRYQGQQAQVKLIDANSGGWGHILADHFTFSDEPALSVVERADWVDFGKDNYAGITWDNVPTGERFTIGWMSNWEYAGSTPTSPWRSSMTVPRRLSLRTIDGEVRLTQEPVTSLRSLREGDAITANKLTIPEGSTPLAGGSGDGKTLEIDATFDVADADRFGLKLATGPGQETVVGYDTVTEELYVDRTQSGRDDFSPGFPGVHRAPLEPRSGKVRIKVLLDWSSVEVFGGDGDAVITDLIFPDPDSDGVELFAEGGSARLDQLTLRHLGSFRD
ncbi:glycosyl hydrolase family 32 [Nocardioides gansuensis]|uniref:Glycosyl hydrolase family 32 n=1 Tax=Nocardioides gansuensis TaxID=2138300 RepID=A0A2T8F6E7_9ACTN|nr:glycoside hydrolase family 32 protein [Nocardioides gansuensis]PVG81286.1 glycosyl hydrolase family 32 [Nocardioides gansuensis]